MGTTSAKYYTLCSIYCSNKPLRKFKVLHKLISIFLHLTISIKEKFPAMSYDARAIVFKLLLGRGCKKKMEYVDYHVQPIVRWIPSYSKDTSNFLRVLKTHHRNSKKFVPWNTWCKITLNKHPKLKWNKMSEYIPWKPYENGSNHYGNTMEIYSWPLLSENTCIHL